MMHHHVALDRANRNRVTSQRSNDQRPPLVVCQEDMKRLKSTSFLPRCQGQANKVTSAGGGGSANFNCRRIRSRNSHHSSSPSLIFPGRTGDSVKQSSRKRSTLPVFLPRSFFYCDYMCRAASTLAPCDSESSSSSRPAEVLASFDGNNDEEASTEARNEYMIRKTEALLQIMSAPTTLAAASSSDVTNHHSDDSHQQLHRHRHDIVETTVVSNMDQVLEDAWQVLDWWVRQRTVDSVQWSMDLLQLLARCRSVDNLNAREAVAFHDEDIDGDVVRSLERRTSTLSTSKLLQALVVNWSLVRQYLLKAYERDCTIYRANDDNATTANSNNVMPPHYHLPTPQQLWQVVERCREQHPDHIVWTPVALNWLISSAVVKSMSPKGFKQQHKHLPSNMHRGKKDEDENSSNRQCAEFCTQVLLLAWDEQILERHQQQSQRQPTSSSQASSISQRVVNLTLRAWKDYGRATGDDCSPQVLRVLEDARQRNMADTISYNTVLATLSEHQRAVEAEKLLLDWADSYQNYLSSCEASPSPLPGSVVPAPDLVSLHCVLKAWGWNNGPGKADNTVAAADHCLALFGKIHNPSHSLGKLGLQPTTTTFNVLMHCWSRQLQHMSPEKAEESARLTRVLLDEMANQQQHQKLERGGILHHDGGDDDSGGVHEEELMDQYADSDTTTRKVEPDMVSYSTAFNVFAKAGQVEMAQELLDDLYRRYMDRGEQEYRPTPRMWTSLLEAWSRSRSEDRVERAEDAWKRWRELAECGFIAAPGVVAYNIMMQVYIRAEKLDIAQSFMERMTNEDAVSPDRWTYGSMLFATIKAKHRSSGKKAAEILTQAVRNGVALDINAWNSTIASLSRSREYALAQELLNQVLENQNGNLFTGEFSEATYNPLLHRLQYDSNHSAPVIDTLVRQLEKLYHEQVLEEPPNYLAYKSLAVAWAKYEGFSRLKAAEKALEIFKFMRQQAVEGFVDMEPDATVYHSVMRAYCQATCYYEAQDLLRQMFDGYRARPETAARPSVDSFEVILTGLSRWKNSRAVHNAIDLMHAMAKSNLKPSIACYELLITTIARTNGHKFPHKAEEMEKWLVRMEHHSQPTSKAYRLVADAFVRTSNSEKALELLQTSSHAFPQESPPTKIIKKISEMDDLTENQRSIMLRLS